MKKLLSAVLIIVLCFTLTGFSQVIETDDSVVFVQAIDQLKHINSRGSVEAAYDMLIGITTNYNQSRLFATYASAIMDIYDEDFDRTQAKLDVLSMVPSFTDMLSEYDLPSCETISTYLDARLAEKEGRLNEAFDLYISITFLDSVDRSIDLMLISREQAYEAAMSLFNEGQYYKAYDAFAALGNYSKSREMSGKALELHNQNHKYSPATCTEPEICEECGAVGAPALGHDWKGATCTEPRTCRRCRLTEGEPLGHAWKDATCTEPGVCTRCEAVGTDPTGHDWKEATCTEPKKCMRCGVTEGEPLDHNWLPATYEAPITCSRCGLTKGEKLYPPIKVGDIVTYGTYPKTSSGTDETPIEWLVLDVQDDKALLISKYGLDTQQYNTRPTDVTWETCTLRMWLNNEFINKAFSEQEEQAILTTTVDNSKSQGYSGWYTNGGNNTEDKIFLLSYAEAHKYFSVQHKSVSDSGNNIESRVAPTAYAIKQGAYTNSSCITADDQAAGYWWLRSPGYYRSYAALVLNDGSLGDYSVSYSSACVRPAFWINLSSAVLGE